MDLPSFAKRLRMAQQDGQDTDLLILNATQLRRAGGAALVVIANSPKRRAFLRKELAHRANATSGLVKMALPNE